MSREFYWEYMQECDDLIQSFLVRVKNLNSAAMIVGGINLEKAIANWLWQKIFSNSRKDLYTQKRSSGQDYRGVIQSLWDLELRFLLPLNHQVSTGGYFPIIGEIEKPLEEYHNVYIFFCLNERQYKYYLPILSSFEGKAVLLTMAEINDTMPNKNNISIIKFGLILSQVIPNNDYLKDKFTYLYVLTNTLYTLVAGLRPKGIIVLEGCHFQEEVLSSVAKVLNVKTICIQQGWPCLIHTRFKNLTYDYFLTWGSQFSKLWSAFNTHPRFIEVGYPYKVSEQNRSNKRAITFFFQAPLFVIDNVAFKQMVDFALFCASRFKDRQVLIREHPEYSISDHLKTKFIVYSNIELVTYEKLDRVYERSEISVSIFSSTLVESIVHDTIPFVFNPTSMPHYYPNLNSDRLGVEAKSLSEAKLKMESLIKNRKNRDEIKKIIFKNKNRYFTCSGEQAIQNILKSINRVSVL